MKPIYLDNNSTTVIDDEVAQAMRTAMAAGYCNPASQHAAGRRARAELEDAREAIAQMLGASVDQFRGDRLILTSGGTESNNLAIQGISAESDGQIIISAIEHPSISQPADQLMAAGRKVVRLAVDSSGVVDLDQLRQLVQKPTRLVSVMLGNNETGVIQPVRQIVEICRPLGIPVHTDATQAVGKIRVSFRDLGVSALTFAAHKLHGPRGIGGLLLVDPLPLKPLHTGGFQQGSQRAGTETVELAIGLRKALEIATVDPVATEHQLAKLRDQLEGDLLKDWPDMIVLSADAPRLPHTLAVAFVGLDRQALVMALDLAGIACSTGSACASGSAEPSPTLAAMNAPSEVVESAIRLSVSRMNTPGGNDRGR